MIVLLMICTNSNHNYKCLRSWNNKGIDKFIVFYNNFNQFKQLEEGYGSPVYFFKNKADRKQGLAGLRNYAMTNAGLSEGDIVIFIDDSYELMTDVNFKYLVSPLSSNYNCNMGNMPINSWTFLIKTSESHVGFRAPKMFKWDIRTSPVYRGDIHDYVELYSTPINLNIVVMDHQYDTLRSVKRNKIRRKCKDDLYYWATTAEEFNEVINSRHITNKGKLTADHRGINYKLSDLHAEHSYVRLAEIYQNVCYYILIDKLIMKNDELMAYSKSINLNQDHMISLNHQIHQQICKVP